MLPSHKNQSVDLQSKSTDCFYVIGTLVVNGLNDFFTGNFLVQVGLSRFNVISFVIYHGVEKVS